MGIAYQVLGDLAVVDDDSIHHVSGRQGEILAILLAAHPDSVTVGRLVEEVWGDDPPKDPQASLHNLVSRLRGLVGSDLATTPNGYELLAETIDYMEFEQAVAVARETGQLEDYEKAAGLWHGEPFRGFEDLPSVQIEAERLSRLHSRLQLQRLVVMTDSGQSSLAADELVSIVEANPYDEEALAIYMKALYKAGKKRTALAAFRRYEKELAAETGLEPTAAIRELELAILTQQLDKPEPISRPVTQLDLAIRYIDLDNGQQIAVGSAGSGPPIVVHPGWMSKLDEIAAGMDMRTPMWAALAETHEVTIFDRAGTGLSRPARGEMTFEASTQELAAVLETIFAEPVPIWAASGAGPIAIRTAVERPDLVSHLILYATYASGPATFPREVADSMIALVRSSWGMGSEVLANLLIPSGSLEIRDAWAQLQHDMADTETAARLMRQFYDADVSGELHRIDIPCLIVHYRDDKAIPIRGGEQLARGIPGAKYIPLEGLSHYPLPGQEQKVVELIDSFLQETVN